MGVDFLEDDLDQDQNQVDSLDEADEVEEQVVATPVKKVKAKRGVVA